MGKQQVNLFPLHHRFTHSMMAFLLTGHLIIMIFFLQDCNIFILDHTDSVQVDDCINCHIVIGPCAGRCSCTQLYASFLLSNLYQQIAPKLLELITRFQNLLYNIKISLKCTKNWVSLMPISNFEFPRRCHCGFYECCSYRQEVNEAANCLC